jgi:hypothetical protein
VPLQLEDINPDHPILLKEAVRLAFPDGSMTVSGLRKERDRERLVTEMIAGKEYTTLNNIKAMRRLCLHVVNPQGSCSKTPAEHAQPHGSSATPSTGSDMKRAQAAASSILTTLGRPSSNISRAGT